MCSSEKYLSSNERYALLVSAVCHDVGHPGLNNAFLVETAHELALRYNDKSPLENMHCSRLFEFASVPNQNVFASMSKLQFQEVRKVCIEAILHTDMANHFPMIKEVQMTCEVHTAMLDENRALWTEDPSKFPNKDGQECFRQPESRKLFVNLFLHFADISNSMKPMRICKLWALRVLEEFFLQGDTEKERGVPVQALNDRDKVNRPLSQIGFIEFLISPLAFGAAQIFPPMAENAEHMLANVRMWHKEWLDFQKPTPTDEEKEGLVKRITKLQDRYREAMTHDSAG
eukprot:gnl/TRDRNA2_/TRDRNA2_168214_c8_seq3.p1 gnl/TRDRNA2_/TRDRNA2_168214_c8~~gnl/TRDRNA2_/TRDRNA2_168214_c8_seq3.p1  ORF type:complete len:307 (-),score=62.21 gnl/TRDRNA2_/TRDRNA2_168214_c8_seq3:226-1086(-)